MRSTHTKIAARLLLGVTFSSMLGFLQLGATPHRQSPMAVRDGLRDTLIAYLHKSGQSPEDYIVNKFEHHDIVFVGEYHWIKHDVELIQDLIPRLYAIGVRRLGIEFGCYEFQDSVDYLLNAPIYDEGLARRLMFRFSPLWGFVEYEDLYKRAWELNNSLPDGAPKFRIVGLGYRYRFDNLKKDTSGRPNSAYPLGNPDEYMVKTVFKEFIDRREKALVYCGSSHAFPRYRQPQYNSVTRQITGYEDPPMGLTVRKRMLDRAFCILLHYPLKVRMPSNHGTDKLRYPVDDAIDFVMSECKGERFGFDVVGSPFKDLPDSRSGNPEDSITLSNYCDGYVFQRPFREYEGCTVDTLFITPSNIDEAVRFLPEPSRRRLFSEPADFIRMMRYDADFKQRFESLQ